MLLEVINYLNKYSNLVMALMSILLFLVTFAYAIFTRRMLKEMRLAREADLRPYLLIDVFHVDTIFYLLLKNSGRTAAKNVKFNLDKTVEVIFNKKLNEMPLFKHGVTIFPPEKEFIIKLGSAYMFLGEERNEARHPSRFEIIVEYSYLNGLKTKETVVINLQEFFQTNPRPDAVAKSIKELSDTINKSLNSIAQSSEKLSRIEEIFSPTGINISQGSLYRLAEVIRESSKDKIRFDLNLSTLMELVELLGIDLKIAENILTKRWSDGYFRSFDDLKDIEGVTDEVIDSLKKQTFICTPNF